MPWECLGAKETNVCVCVRERESEYLGTRVLCFSLRHVQRHCVLFRCCHCRRKSSCSSTEEPAQRKAHPVEPLNAFQEDGEEESSMLVVVVVGFCFLVFCLSMFFLWVFWKLSVRVLFALWLKSSPTLRTVPEVWTVFAGKSLLAWSQIRTCLSVSSLS